MLQKGLRFCRFGCKESWRLWLSPPLYQQEPLTPTDTNASKNCDGRTYRRPFIRMCWWLTLQRTGAAVVLKGHWCAAGAEKTSLRGDTNFASCLYCLYIQQHHFMRPKNLNLQITTIFRYKQPVSPIFLTYSMSIGTYGRKIAISTLHQCIFFLCISVLYAMRNKS